MTTCSRSSLTLISQSEGLDREATIPRVVRTEDKGYRGTFMLHPEVEESLVGHKDRMEECYGQEQAYSRKKKKHEGDLRIQQYLEAFIIA